MKKSLKRDSTSSDPHNQPAIFLLTAAIYFVYIPVRLFVKAKIDPLFFYRCLITLQALSHQR